MQEKNGRMNSFRMHGALLLKRKRLKACTAMTSPRVTALDYTPINIIGKGAFGVVYCARTKTGQVVAIKKVLIDPQYKNREFEIIKSIKHPNCISLIEAFNTHGRTKSEVFLNIVMEYFPESLHDFDIQFRQKRLYPPLLFVKLFSYQLLAGLAYMHSKGIVHRDIKPQNALVNPETGILKICDFGSAKVIKTGEKSVSYIASRYYRAPELILECPQYTSAIDIWAAGCVICECLSSGQPIFHSDSSFGMLNSIISVIGRPSEDDLKSFKHDVNVIPNDFVKTTTLKNSLPKHTPPEILDLLEKIFVYNPKKRITAKEAMDHPCFNDIFKQGLILPSGKPFPYLEKIEKNSTVNMQNLRSSLQRAKNAQ